MSEMLHIPFNEMMEAWVQARNNAVEARDLLLEVIEDEMDNDLFNRITNFLESTSPLLDKHIKKI